MERFGIVIDVGASTADMVGNNQANQYNLGKYIIIIPL
jgi:hypothetical protein